VESSGNKEPSAQWSTSTSVVRSLVGEDFLPIMRIPTKG
jgi:hypothetical protein